MLIDTNTSMETEDEQDIFVPATPKKRSKKIKEKNATAKKKKKNNYSDEDTPCLGIFIYIDIYIS